jgi:hypothetical protein
MTAIIFGEVDPRVYVVPDAECMACRHPAEFHSDLHDGCASCSCRRRWCYLHDALDGEHDCDEDVDW